MLKRLWEREYSAETFKNSSIKNEDIYSQIYPNTTAFNVLNGRYPSIIRKFSPCGQFLITFSHLQHGIDVYRYNFAKNTSLPSTSLLSDPFRSHQRLGNQMAVDLELDEGASIPALPHDPSVTMPFTTNSQSGLDRLLFDDFFQLAYSSLLTSAPELLSPDFCLFTSCKKFIILASAVPSNQRDQSVPIPALQHQNRYRSRQETRVHSLDDVTFWILDLQTGTVQDKFTLYNDFIYLSHHAGVSLHHSTLAISSVHTQTIHLLHLSTTSSPSGKPACKFVPLLEIGWYLRNDDGLYLSMHEESLGSSAHENEVVEEEAKPQLLPLLQQRIMSFLYRRALSCSNVTASIAHFHLTFGIFTSLLLYRSQFIDSKTLLIKYATAASLTSRTPDLSSAHPSFFVVYCLETTNVLSVFENGSKEMLELWLGNSCLRPSAFPQSCSTNKTTGTTTTTMHPKPAAISSPADNKYANAAAWKGIWAIKKAKNGGSTASIRRAVSHLPINPQSFSESPYFDLDLFSFDDKVVNPMERGRPCLDYPCKFFDRKTGRLKFKLDSNPSPRYLVHRSQKRSAIYLFHPYEPLCLSIQYSATYNAPNVNIHYRT